MGVKVCKSVNNFLLPPPPPDMKGELRKPTVIGGLKIKSRNLLTFLACNPLQKLNPPFAQNLTSEVSLTKSYGFGLSFSAARNLIKSYLQTQATTIAFASVFILLLWENSWPIRATSMLCHSRIFADPDHQCSAIPVFLRIRILLSFAHCES